MNQPIKDRTAIVGNFVGMAIRGEPLPELATPETAQLLAAVRAILAKPEGSGQFQHDLELIAFAALTALNTRLKAEVHFAKAIGRTRLQ